MVSGLFLKVYGLGLASWRLIKALCLYAFILGVFLLLLLGPSLAGASSPPDPTVTLVPQNQPNTPSPTPVNDSSSQFVPHEVLVKFRPGASAEDIRTIHEAEGTSDIYTSPFAGFKLLKIPKEKTEYEVVENFRRNPFVEYAQPNFISYAFWSPNDPYYNYQWHFPKMNMGGAWDFFIPGGQTTPVGVGAGVVVAVLDTGVAYEDYDANGDGTLDYRKAPDLANITFVAGYDFSNNDAHPNDDHSHGTHVTGTIAQSTNNGLGVAGVAFNASIMPVKVLDSNGSGTAATLADGLYYATNNGAKVINMSLGFPVYPTGPYDPGPVVYDAIKYAYNHGVTLVAAAGNDGRQWVAYPAAYPEVIAVGATRYDDNRSYYSNRGDALGVTAPGGDLNVDQNGDGYADGVLQNTFNPNTKNTSDFGYWFLQGTSMAAPHVAGLAALLLAQDSSRTNAQVRNLIEGNVDDKGSSGWDSYYGYGRVNAYKALSAGTTGSGNHLVNPSFELWPSTLPNGWQVDRFGLGRGDVVQSTDAQSGVYSYQVTGDGTGIEQTVNLVVGRTYTLSFWYKNVSGSGKTVLEGTGSISDPALGTPGENVWRSYSQTFVAGQSSQIVAVRTGYGYATIRLDNFSLIEASGGSSAAHYNLFDFVRQVLGRILMLIR